MNLVITKAYKGGTIVLLDSDDFIKKANEQLSDKIFYQRQNRKICKIKLINRTTEI